MSLWLGKRRARPYLALGVQVWNNGEVTVEKPRWNEGDFAFPILPPARDEAIHPTDQSNELLVVIQNRQLRIFVNDRHIGQAIELPEVLFPAQFGIAAWHLGAGEAHVQFLRYALWDLDNPQ